MRSASPQTQIQFARLAVLPDDTEVTFQPGGGYVATSRVEHGDGALEIVIESFDRYGVSGGRQSATIRGCSLASRY